MGNTIPQVTELASSGFTGTQTLETGRDPCLPLVLAAKRRETVGLMTAIPVVTPGTAYARDDRSHTDHPV